MKKRSTGPPYSPDLVSSDFSVADPTKFSQENYLDKMKPRIKWICVKKFSNPMDFSVDVLFQEMNSKNSRNLIKK